MSRRLKLIIDIVALLALIALILGAIYYFLEHYRIDPAKVYVEGNHHYTTSEITDMVMTGPFGDNSKYLSIKYKHKRIENVPFIDSVSVIIQSADSIRIQVFEKALAGCVSYLDHYIYFDKDGYVVESSSELTPGVPQVSGIAFSSFEVGKPLGDSDAEIFTRTLDVTKQVNKYELMVDRIYFHDDDAVTLFFGDVRVDLGNDPNHLEDKIMELPQFLPHLEGKKGVLDMEEYDADLGLYVFKLDEQ